MHRLAPTGGTDLAVRCPGIHDAIVGCSAFVNRRRMDAGEPPVLVPSFWRKNL